MGKKYIVIADQGTTELFAEWEYSARHAKNYVVSCRKPCEDSTLRIISDIAYNAAYTPRKGKRYFRNRRSALEFAKHVEVVANHMRGRKGLPIQGHVGVEYVW